MADEKEQQQPAPRPPYLVANPQTPIPLPGTTTDLYGPLFNVDALRYELTSTPGFSEGLPDPIQNKTIQIKNGTVTNGGLDFYGDPGNGIYYLTSDNWALSTGGQKRIELDNTGVEIDGTLRVRNTSDTSGSLSFFYDGSLSRVEALSETLVVGGNTLVSLRTSDVERLAINTTNLVSTVDVDPTSTGLDLGDSTHRWDLFAQAVDISSSITLGYMTQNSVLFVGASGLVSQDNTNFTFNDSTDTLTATNAVIPTALTLSYITAKSVLFGGTGGLVSQDNTNFNFTDSTDTLLIKNLNVTGAFDHDGTTFGVFGASPASQVGAYTLTYATTTRTLNAYTSDSESSAYTGIDNTQAGTVYATVADLNALRTAYENLRTSYDNEISVLRQVIGDLITYGFLTT